VIIEIASASYSTVEGQQDSSRKNRPAQALTFWPLFHRLPVTLLGSVVTRLIETAFTR
jgi:hypothetical protein